MTVEPETTTKTDAPTPNAPSLSGVVGGADFFSKGQEAAALALAADAGRGHFTRLRRLLPSGASEVRVMRHRRSSRRRIGKL